MLYSHTLFCFLVITATLSNAQTKLDGTTEVGSDSQSTMAQSIVSRDTITTQAGLSPKTRELAQVLDLSLEAERISQHLSKSEQELGNYWPTPVEIVDTLQKNMQVLMEELEEDRAELDKTRGKQEKYKQRTIRQQKVWDELSPEEQGKPFNQAEEHVNLMSAKDVIELREELRQLGKAAVRVTKSIKEMEATVLQKEEWIAIKTEELERAKMDISTTSRSTTQEVIVNKGEIEKDMDFSGTSITGGIMEAIAAVAILYWLSGGDFSFLGLGGTLACAPSSKEEDIIKDGQSPEAVIKERCGALNAEAALVEGIAADTM